MLKHLVFFKASILTCWLAGIVTSTQPQVSPCARQACYSHFATEDAAACRRRRLARDHSGTQQLECWTGLEPANTPAQLQGHGLWLGCGERTLGQAHKHALRLRHPAAPVQARGPLCGHLGRVWPLSTATALLRPHCLLPGQWQDPLRPCCLPASCTRGCIQVLVLTPSSSPGPPPAQQPSVVPHHFADEEPYPSASQHKLSPCSPALHSAQVLPWGPHRTSLTAPSSPQSEAASPCSQPENQDPKHPGFLLILFTEPASQTKVQKDQVPTRGEERETDTASLESLSEVFVIQSLCRSVPQECCSGGHAPPDDSPAHISVHADMIRSSGELAATPKSPNGGPLSWGQLSSWISYPVI